MIPFNVNNLPFTEPMLSVWAQLVNLAGSKVEKHRMKSPNQGLSGITCFLLLFLLLTDATMKWGSLLKGLKSGVTTALNRSSLVVF